MTFPILGGNGAVAGYSIDNSLRFNDADNPHLTWTPASSGNRRTWTMSCWFKKCEDGLNHTLFSTTGTQDIRFASNERLLVYGESKTILNTNRLFRDVSSWYHIVVACDTTQATASNRVKLYINGVQETSFETNSQPSQNYDWNFNNTVEQGIGERVSTGGLNPHGYLAEFNWIDGQQLSPTDFGEFDEDSGIWKPIEYSGSYGTNGFYLDFSNSSDFGEDFSGNGNDLTPTNLASTDQTTDTPTNNFATLNATLYVNGTSTFSEGNTKLETDATAKLGGASTQGVSSGKWYCEIKAITASTFLCGVSYNPQESMRNSNHSGFDDWSWGYFGATGEVYNNNSPTSYGSSLSNNDIVMIALDLDNSKLYFGINGTWQNSGVPTSGAIGTGAVSIDSNETYFFEAGDSGSGTTGTFELNFGNPSFSITSGNSDDNGYGNFEYAPPTGYLSLCSANLATELSPTIDDGSQYFNTVLYTGNHPTGQSITGVGFQPDWVWGKGRSNAQASRLFDSTRGALNNIISNGTNAEQSLAGSLTSFDSDGFTLGSDDSINFNGRTFVAWNWLANGGTTSSNTDGSITSTVQANTTAGFSIVTFTGTGANGNFGHGLGAVPKFIIFKNRTDVSNWICYHEALGNTTGVYLNLTNANAGTSSAFFNNTTPTSSVVSVGVMNEGNGSGDNIVAYCFAEIEGYSSINSYTGNGSDDGTFIYTGFRPAFVMMKKTSGTGNWNIFDSTRDIDNVGHHLLFANLNNAEETTTSNRDIDFLSNGFKQREGANQDTNGSGGTYIYLAFAENPFVSSTGIPVTAR